MSNDERQIVRFLVSGKPQPWQRVKRGKGGVAYVPEPTSAYEELVAWRAKDAMRSQPPTRHPVLLILEFELVIPKSWSKTKQRDAAAGLIAATKKPDVSNLQKGVEDAMNGIVYLDDSQIVGATTTKCYGRNPGVTITVLEDTRANSA